MNMRFLKLFSVELIWNDGSFFISKAQENFQNYFTKWWKKNVSTLRWCRLLIYRFLDKNAIDQHKK